MHTLAMLNILGAPEEEFGIFKLIVPVLIAVFWVVAQILSALGNKKKDRRPPAEADYPVSLPPEAPMPQPQPQRAPKQQRQVKHRVETRQQQRQRQQPTRSAPPPLQVRQQPQRAAEPIAAATSDSTDSVASRQLGVVQPKKTTGPNANERLRALLRPGNLKKEFILTEILQPPVGIRSDRV